MGSLVAVRLPLLISLLRWMIQWKLDIWRMCVELVVCYRYSYEMGSLGVGPHLDKEFTMHVVLSGHVLVTMNWGTATTYLHM